MAYIFEHLDHESSAVTARPGINIIESRKIVKWTFCRKIVKRKNKVFHGHKIKCEKMAKVFLKRRKI